MRFAYIIIQIGPVFRELYPNTFPPWVFFLEIFYFQKVIIYENSNKVIDQIYDQFGPIPRLCFDKAFQPRQLESYLRDFKRALQTLTPQKLEALVDESGSLTMGAVSDKICLIRRVGSVEASDDLHISPISDFVGSQIAIHFRDLQRCDLVQLYRHVVAVPSARDITGKVFEAYGQHLFRRQISIDYLPMVSIPDQTSSDNETQALGSPRHQWHSGHASSRLIYGVVSPSISS
jgi:hypothetical protein